MDCPSTSQCVAVDYTGHVIEFDPNGAATVTTLAGAGLLESIACPSTLECVAVDALGDLFVGGITPPANVGAPTIAGSPVQGQTLTETQGIWTNSPTGFALQWQDCDSAGNRCVAIPGATSPTLTLTSADLDHTIRVAETASNAAGSGTPASSAATDLVTAPAAPPTTTAPPPPPSSPSPPSIQISAAQIKAGLLAQISPHAARIATLLKRRGYTLTFTALTAGRLTINWTSVAVAGPARATPGKAGVLVAAGTVSFTKAGTLRLQIKLTAPGRRLLAVARRLRLSARGTFVPTGQSAIIALTRFTLAR